MKKEYPVYILFEWLDGIPVYNGTSYEWAVWIMYSETGQGKCIKSSRDSYYAGLSEVRKHDSLADIYSKLVTEKIGAEKIHRMRRSIMSEAEVFLKLL